MTIGPWERDGWFGHRIRWWLDKNGTPTKRAAAAWCRGGHGQFVLCPKDPPGTDVFSAVPSGSTRQREKLAETLARADAEMRRRGWIPDRPLADALPCVAAVTPATDPIPGSEKHGGGSSTTNGDA